LAHVNKKSGYTLANKLDIAKAVPSKLKTIERFKYISKNKKYTIIYDNGFTFSEHELTGKKTGMAIHFAYPYHSWKY
jgi:IS30 family transposase